MLKIGTRKTKYGYRGYLACYHGKQKLWKEYCGLNKEFRLNRADALEDANKLLEYYNIWEEE